MQDVRHDEQPTWIALNGVRRIVLSCSPHDTAALVMGHLLAEGWIRGVADVHSLSVDEHGEDGRTGVSAQIDPAHLDAVELVRRHQTLHGCGLRHALDCDPFSILPVQPTALPIDPVPLLRSLFAASDERAPGGGVHAAALSDGAALSAVATDVARHCAVDRSIGLGIAAHGDLSALGLVCTARISGAMALKAVRAQIGWIASRSIATSLARDIADAHGLLLLERAGRPLPDT
ncbi:MAG: formate dehydrogenase accessory sulfurtransferase FdhD [Gemmatimonadetes bacterium]|nr:formate dehydrogenase accessory sulfurtransferase FdhD [Gemmatimonadota bacterium]